MKRNAPLHARKDARAAVQAVEKVEEGEEGSAGEEDAADSGVGLPPRCRNSP
jgi:hypothetical protein